MCIAKKSQPRAASSKEWIEPALPPFLCSYLPNGHTLANFSIFDYPNKTQQSKVSQTIHSHESASCHRGTCLGSTHPCYLTFPEWGRHQRMTANSKANHYPEVAALEMEVWFSAVTGRWTPRTVESKAGLTEKACLPTRAFQTSTSIRGLGRPFRA